MADYLTEAAKGKLQDLFLDENIKMHIRTNDNLRNRLMKNLKSNSILTRKWLDVAREPEEVIKLMDRDKITQEHSQIVAEWTEGMAEYLNIDRKRAWEAGIYHDIGKLWIPDRVKYWEFAAPEPNPYALEEIRFGHALLGEVMAKLAELPEHLLYAIGYHHDRKHPDGYPHLAFTLPDEVKALQVANEVYPKVVQVADAAQALQDKNRKELSWFKRNGVEIKEKEDIYRFLVKGVYTGWFEKPYVDAFLKLSGLDEDRIHDLYQKMEKKAL